MGEDVRYLAGIIGWPAAIWKVTRTAVLNSLVVLACVLALALPQMHLIGKAIAGVLLAIQVGRLLFFLRRVRRDANQSRLTERLASGTRPAHSPKMVGSRPPAGSPRGVNLARLPPAEQPARSDQ